MQVVRNNSIQDRVALERSITFKDYVAIGFGVMIGVGWVVYSGQWLISGGTLGAVMAFIIAGVLFVPVGKCYAELTAAIPVTGGELAFAFKAFGPFGAFLTAWVLALAYVSVVPFETIAIGAMTEAILPRFVTPVLYEVQGYPIRMSALVPGILAGLCVAWLNWSGARDTARFQKIVIVAMLGCTLLFVAIAVVRGDLANFRPLFAGAGDWWRFAPTSILAVLVVVPFFLGGFDCIPQAAEEAGLSMKPRQLGVAILTAIAVGVCFYVVIIVILSYLVSGEELTRIVERKDELPLAVVFREKFALDWAATTVLVAALLGIISTLNGIFMAGTRLLFALGRGGLLPAWFAQIHPQRHTPHNAVKFVGLIAVLGPFVGSAALSLIVNSVSLAFVGAFLMTGLSTLRLRRLEPGLKRPYHAGTINIWIAIVVCAALCMLMLIPASPAFAGGGTIAVFGVWLTLGLALYLYESRNNRLSPEQQSRQILGDYS